LASIEQSNVRYFHALALIHITQNYPTDIQYVFCLLRWPISLIWESPQGNERLWAGAIVAAELSILRANKIRILQPVTYAHVRKLPEGPSLQQFKVADITRIMNQDAVDELIKQILRNDVALRRLEAGAGMFVYCLQGCNRTPVWCISFLMAKTGKPLSTCSKHYMDMRSLTYLDDTAMSFLQRNEGKLRNAFNVSPPRWTYPLPMILEEDAWNETAAQRPGAFPEKKTTEEDDASIRVDGGCFTQSKKQKQNHEITEKDDDIDCASDLPDLVPADVDDTGGSLSASSSTLPMVTPPPEVIEVTDDPTPWPPCVQRHGQDGRPLPSARPDKKGLQKHRPLGLSLPRPQGL